VAQASRLFALGRTAYYEALRQWHKHGWPGLLAHRCGPRGPHKLTPEIVGLLQEWRDSGEPADSVALAQHLWRERSLHVHPRSIDKALRGRQKKGRPGLAPAWCRTVGTSATKRCGPRG
jgi:hypothetical protein